MQDRDFKGVWIPKEIWLNEELTMLEKCILTEIDSLDNGENGCIAGNEYLAKFCQCSETKVSNAVSKLIKLGYIFIKSFDGRIRVLQSRLTKSVRQDNKNCNADLQKVYAINIDNNKDNKINYNNIVDYLNLKAKTNYRSTTPKTQSLIRARLNDGFTEDDFKKVIDNKCKEWIGTEFEKFLRPETLFGNKFENYLNANIIERKKGITELKAARMREYTKEQLDALYDNLEEVEI